MAWNHTHAVMSFHWAHFQRCFIGLEPSHRVRPGFVDHVRSRQPALVVRGPLGLAPSGNRLMSSYHFSKKVCSRYENLNLLFIKEKTGFDEGREC